MTRKRLFKEEISKSISVRVPTSKAVRMLYLIREYIRHLDNGGKTFIQLMGLLKDKDEIIDDLRDLSQPRPLTEKDKKRIKFEFDEY